MNPISSQENKKDLNNLCCIVIPIYKDKLSEYEITSLKQCCAILGKYSIIFITHEKLDCSVYNSICDGNNVSYRYEYFKKKYFSSISSYNALLLSKSFYTRFIDYEYMLIYQLDAYVFKDELEYWCKKGYDYIGAPWLKLNSLMTTPEFYTPPTVGNGGFSLRNINKIIGTHNLRISMIGFTHLFDSHYSKLSIKSQKNILYYIPRFFFSFLLKVLKYLFFKKHRAYNNEDYIWSILFHKKGVMPSVDEAVKFSFEYFPEYLYQLNNEKLPFGCHKWYEYYHYFFYKNHL